jgi:DNA-binding PadR family transcriptional regulator
MTNDKKYHDLLDPYLQELRRGLIVMAVLSQLDEPQYGYSLIKLLGEKGFEVDQGTLYPLLRRLEERGLLESDWVVDDPRPRKYYRINSTGDSILTDLKMEWDALVQVLKGVLS